MQLEAMPLSKCGRAASRLQSIMLEPASYIHPRRLCLPPGLDTPRHQMVVNQMLLQGVSVFTGYASQYAKQVLLQYWFELPAICHLLGAQLLRNELARGGKLLQLSMPVRSFMALPLWPPVSDEAVSSGTAAMSSDAQVDQERYVARYRCEDPWQSIQRAGLDLILHWQKDAPPSLLQRLRLLFPPELDQCFEQPRRALRAGELFLILQAIQYAKNHSDFV